MMTCWNFKKEKAGEDSVEPTSSKPPLKKLKEKNKKHNTIG